MLSLLGALGTAVAILATVLLMVNMGMRWG